MKILYFNWNAYANEYIRDAFKSLGHSLVDFDFPTNDNVKSNGPLTEKIVKTIIEKQPDFCFSLNYFPVIAMACMACKIKYVSWTYDSPYVLLYSDTIKYPTNYAFIFDKSEVINLNRLGVNTVYFLPMGAPVEKYDSFKASSAYSADIAMIGSMYSEKKHRLFSKLDLLSDYSKGYISAIVNAQKGLYGVSITEQSLTSEIIEEMRKSAPLLLPGDELQSPEWLYARYFLDREVTRLERFEYLKALSELYEVTLYTHEKTPDLPRIKNKGTVEYYNQMPIAFKSAKINLNITLRSIVTGIPLRAVDIMACGGFLLTNYQEDFLDFFEPNKDFVFFESKDDLCEKAGYYLKHEDERLEIAHNGYQKVKSMHNYKDKIVEIINTVFPEF